MSEKQIDLRSDTVTLPTAAMRTVMAEAEVGDDVYREDPSVCRLEAMTAALLGHEAGLFAPSGTQTNLVALLTHCGRGDEYIVGQSAHTYKYEGGGAAALGGIQPQPLEFNPDGTLPLALVKAAIKEPDIHFARTRLICLENTNSGKVLPLDYLHDMRALADENGLGLHLDGARVMNAAVKLKCKVDTVTRLFDSVSLCLSKGLGAPVGSVLVGSRDFIEQARRWRKMVGGGMRQAGILASAGIFALQHHVERLAEDHDNAMRLGQGLSDLPIIWVNKDAIQTNMVFAEVADSHLERLVDFLNQRGIRIANRNPLRLVTHLNISRADIDRVCAAVRAFAAAALVEYKP